MARLNGKFWGYYFRTLFCKQIRSFTETVRDRLLPTFNHIEKEAEEAANEEWGRLQSLPCGPDDFIDPSDAAERAEETGIDYYLTMESVRQSVLNMSVASLSHLFEQQLLLFHRRQVLHPAEENDRSLINFQEFRKRLATEGLSLENLTSWRNVHELRVIANVVKHAEGKAAEELRCLRPELFKHPLLRNESDEEPTPGLHLYLPLGGDDIYLTVEDLQHYSESLIQFWNEFGTAISEDKVE